MKSERKQNIINDIKADWQEDIKGNSIENISKNATHYIKILEHLEALKDSTVIDRDNEPQEKVDISSLKRSTSLKVANHDKLKEDEERVFVFHRTLMGGKGFNCKNEEVFVPESIVRREELEHGDSFEFIEGRSYRDKNAYIKLDVPKEIIEPNNIISYEYAILSYDSDIKQYVVKEANIDGITQSVTTLIIHSNDVEKFGSKIKDGVVASIAHMPDRTTARVRWVYPIDEPLPTPPSKKSSNYKTSSKESGLSDVEKTYFEDVNIGILGTDTFIQNYIEEVEKRGGQVHHTDSDIDERIEAVVNKSDIVVIPILQTSHKKAEYAKAYAKEQDKPFLILKSNGRSNFVNEIKLKLMEVKGFINNGY